MDIIWGRKKKKIRNNSFHKGKWQTTSVQYTFPVNNKSSKKKNWEREENITTFMGNNDEGKMGTVSTPWTECEKREKGKSPLREKIKFH